MSFLNFEFFFPYTVSVNRQMIKNSRFRENSNENHHRKEKKNRFHVNPTHNLFMRRSVVQSRQQRNG